MKLMIEVSGGCVCNIVATEEVSIYLIDHDNMEEKDGKEDARKAFQPYLICTPEEFQEALDEALNED